MAEHTQRPASGQAAQHHAELQARLAETQARLRESEARADELSRIVDNADCVILRLNDRGRITFANRFACEIFGCAPGGLTGRCLLDSVLRDAEPGCSLTNLLDAPLAAAELSDPFAWALPVVSEHSLGNGRRAWLSWSLHPMRGPDGAVRELLAVGHDVTAQRAAEQALHANQLTYRLLSEHMADVSMTLDADQRVRYVSPSIRHVLGYEPEEFLALDREALIGSDSLAVCNAARQRRHEELASGMVANDVRSYELELVHKHGHLVPVELRVTAMHAGDEFLGLVGVLREISERKAAEQALRDSERRFRELLEIVPNVAVQGYLADGTVVYWNRASQDIYGYAPEEALGRRMQDLIIPQAMRTDFEQFLARGVATGEMPPAAEMELLRKDGSLVPVYSSHAVVRGLDGAPTLFCIDIDLTERKQMERSLVAARQRAEDASRVKSEFLANMSHEIRTPLNGVLGMLQLLEISGLEEPHQEYVAAALRTGRSLVRIIADILDLSRVEAGRLELVHEPFSPREMLDTLTDALGGEAEAKGLDWACWLDPALPPLLSGDECRLRQVLFNLVGNAVKFTPAGWVSLELARLPHAPPGRVSLRCTVRDSGPGIPEAQQCRLLEAFTRGDDPRCRRQQGAGLGLAIASRLMKLMNGSLAMNSAPDEGTTIHLSLQLPMVEMLPGQPPVLTSPGQDAAGSAAGNEAAQGHALAASPEPLRLLLAEDERTNRLAVSRLLLKLGYAVDEAEDGRQALRLLAERSYDVVIMDVQMPVLDGLTAVRALRDGEAGELNRTTPVVALTAYAMSGDRERMLAAGMDDYMAKPVDFACLHALIRRLAGR